MHEFSGTAQEIWKSSSVSFRCNFLSTTVFLAASLVGLYADHLVATRKSRFLSGFKVQKDKIILGKDRRDLVALAIFNMVFVLFFVCCPMYEWLWDCVQGPSRSNESDEWIWQRDLFAKLPLHAIAAEILFYGFHYLLHSSPGLYNHIHVVHHRFPAPTAMACVYAHPIEFAFANIGAVYAGPILTNAHPKTCYIWSCLAILGTCKGHSGYRMFGHSDYHEEHHWFGRKYNYGGIYVSDYLMGTLADRREKIVD